MSGRLPTPDCPDCSRAVEDRGAVFACAQDCDAALPIPEEWYRDAAARYGHNAAEYMRESTSLGHVYPPAPKYAYREARWAARAAMRAVPGLRGYPAPRVIDPPPPPPRRRFA